MTRALLRSVAAGACLALAACTPFKREVPEIREGIEAYEAGEFAKAEQKFAEANAAEPTSEGHFNQGAATYRQNRHPAAMEQFSRALTTEDDALRARSYFNLGNAQAQAGQLDRAIESYRRTLEINPADHDARYNLEWALLQKQKPQDQQQDSKQQQQQQQASQDSKEQKDEQEQQGQGDEDQQDQQQAQNEQGDGDEQQQQDGSDDGEQQDQQAQNDGQQGQGEEQNPNEEQGDPSQQAQNEQPDQRGEEQQHAASGGDTSESGGEAQQGEAPPRPLTHQETAEILDSLQAGEKNLQMWKFQKRDPRPRSTVDKDW